MITVHGAMELDWADGTYAFRLTVAGLLELESKSGAPIAVIVDRVHRGGHNLNDVRETIRLGLIGGGMAPDKALRLVREQIDDKLGEVGLTYHWQTARAILLVVWVGFQEHPLAPATGEGAETADPNASTSSPFMRKRADLGSNPTS
jgi:hypothetical protein